MSTPVTTTDTPPSEETKVDYEKRFKDTQAEYTRLAQEKAADKKRLIELEAELEVVKSTAKPKVTIPDDQVSVLEDLMYSDPIAWRNKMNALEAEATHTFNVQVDEAKKSKTQQMELNYRNSALQEFQKEHQDVIITDELLQFDIPLRMHKELEEGKVSYNEFLNKVYNYVKTPKVIGSQTTTLDQPNLSTLGGDSTPTRTESKQKGIEQNYANMEF